MDNRNKPDPRRVTMDRTRVRSASSRQSEHKQKKQQDRLARQEQKMAEKMEPKERKVSAGFSKKTSAKPTDKIPTATKTPKVAKPTVSKPTKPSKPTKSSKPSKSPKPQKTPKETKPLLTKESVTRVKNDFQVIVGGRRKKPVKLAGILALIVAVVMLVNACVPIGVFEYVQNVLAGSGTGGGFPVEVSLGNHQLLSVGSDVALLNDSSLLLYKANGKQLFDRQHGYSEPAFTACSARVLVLDRGGKDLRVENRAKTLFTLKTEGRITCADMANNGTFAVVTRGGEYVSEVTVYNAKAKETFVWRSSSRQITAVSLTDNGRFAAVATLHVEGGQAVTGLTMFDTRRGTTLYEQECKGGVAVSLDCKGTTAVLVLTDGVVAVTKTGKRTAYSFEGGTLLGFDNRQSFGTVLLLGMYQDADNNRLLVLDKHLNCKGQGELTKEPISVSAKGNYISVLTDEQVSFFNRKGRLKKEVPLKTDAKQLLCKGNYAIVLTSDCLEEIKK